MKTIIGLSLMVAISAPALAGKYGGPLLVKATGKISNNGIAHTCEIYPKHPDVAGIDLHTLINTASTAKVSNALHVVAQVPSEEYYAYRVVSLGGTSTAVRAERVLLRRDDSSLQEREGKESQELIQLVDKICK